MKSRWQIANRRWLLVLVLGGLAWAQPAGFELTGKMLGYRGQNAELWATLDASGEPENALQMGEITANGVLRVTLPGTIPDNLLTIPQVEENCGDVTPGLKLAAVTDFYVKDNQQILGTGVFANRRAKIEQLLSGSLEGGTKVGFWFYANRAGTIVQNCDSPEFQQISDITFRPGWNEITGFYITKKNKLILHIRNGHTLGLQRWFFVAQ